MTSYGAKKLLEDFLKDVSKEKCGNNSDDCSVNGSVKCHGPIGTKFSHSHTNTKSPIEVDNDNLRHRLCKLREENNALVRQNQELVENLEKLTWEFSKSQNKLRSMDSEIAQWSQSGNISTLREKIASLEEENLSLETKLRECENRYDTAMGRIDNSSREYIDGKNRMDIINKEIKIEKELRQRAESKYKAASESLQLAEEQLAKLKSRAKDRVDQTESQVQELECRLAKSERHMKAKAELEEQLEDTTRRNMDLSREINSLKIKLEDLQSSELENMSLRTDLAKIKQKLLIQESENDKTQEKLRSVENKLKQAQYLCKNLEEEKAELTSDLRSTRERLTSGHERLRSLEDSVCRLESERDKCQSSLEKEDLIKADLEETKLIIKDLENKLVECSKREEEALRQRDYYKTELDSLTLKTKSGMDEFHKLEQLVSRLTADKTELTIDLKHTRQENQHLVDQLESQEQRLQLKEEKLNELTEELTSRLGREVKLEKELSQVTKTLNAKECELSSRNEELKESHQQIQSLSSQCGALKDQLESCRNSLQYYQELLLQRDDELQNEKQKLTELDHKRQRDLSEWTHSVKEYQRSAEELESSLSEFKQANKLLQTELDTALNKKKELEETIESQANLNASTIAELESRATTGSQQLRVLQESLQACQWEIDSLTNKHRENEQELHFTKEKLRKSEGLLKDSERECSDFKRRLASSEAHCSELTARASLAGQLEARLEEVNEQMQVTKRKMELEASRLLSLQHEKEMADEKILSIERELTRERGEHKAVQRELDDTKLQMKCCREELDRALADHVTLEKRLRADIDSLDERVRTAELERDKAQRQSRESETLTHRAHADRKNAQAQLKLARDEATQLKKDLEVCQSDLVAKDRKIREMEGHVSRAQENLIERCRDVDRLEVIVKERTQELEQRAAQLSKLQIGVDDRLKELRYDVEEAKKKEEDARGLLSISLEERESLDRKLQEKVQLMHEAESKLKQLSKELDKRTKKIKELQMELHQSKKTQKEYQEDIEKHKHAQQRLDTLIAELRTQGNASEKEKIRLQSELDQSNQALRMKSKDLENALAKFSDAKVEHVRREAPLQAELREAQQQIQDLKDRHNQELINHKSLYERLASDREKEVTNLNNVFQQLRLALERQTEQLISRHHAALDLAQKNKELKEALAILKEKDQINEAKVVRLEASVSQHQRYDNRYSCYSQNHGARGDELPEEKSFPSAGKFDDTKRTSSLSDVRKVKEQTSLEMEDHQRRPMSSLNNKTVEDQHCKTPRLSFNNDKLSFESCRTKNSEISKSVNLGDLDCQPCRPDSELTPLSTTPQPDNNTSADEEDLVMDDNIYDSSNFRQLLDEVNARIDARTREIRSTLESVRENRDDLDDTVSDASCDSWLLPGHRYRQAGDYTSTNKSSNMRASLPCGDFDPGSTAKAIDTTEKKLVEIQQKLTNLANQ